MEKEKHQCVVAFRASPDGDLACNPGMCPDWESNRQPFGSQAGAQSTEPHQLGRAQNFTFLNATTKSYTYNSQQPFEEIGSTYQPDCRAEETEAQRG